MISKETRELVIVVIVAIVMLTVHHYAQASLVSAPIPPADPLSWYCPDDRCYFPGLDYSEPAHDERFDRDY